MKDVHDAQFTADILEQGDLSGSIKGKLISYINQSAHWRLTFVEPHSRPRSISQGLIRNFAPRSKASQFLPTIMIGIHS
jgi:hypothetical protein